MKMVSDYHFISNICKMIKMKIRNNANFILSLGSIIKMKIRKMLISFRIGQGDWSKLLSDVPISSWAFVNFALKNALP